MNLKRNALGIIAAGALSLSMFSGAMADDIDSSVTLAENTAAASCSMTGLGSQIAGFGTYNWDGDSFEPTGSGIVGINGDAEATNRYAPTGSECKVQISGTQLSGPVGSTPIPVSSITVNGGSPLSGIAANIGGTPSVGNLVDLTLTVTGDPGDLGLYEGTVTFTAMPS